MKERTMATGLMKSALDSVVENTPSQSPRSTNVRKWATEILTKSIQGEKEMNCFDKFSSQIMKDFRELVHTAAASYKLAATRRERIWHDFHLKRLNGNWSSMWKSMTDTLGVEIDDPLLEQSFYQEVVELCMKEYFANDARGKESDAEAYCIILTPDELNVIRYVGGYVARQLLHVYEKKIGEVYRQYCDCLGEMAVEGEGDDVLTYTRNWIDKVNRGGLYPINDSSFQLFVEIEKKVRVYLTKHLRNRESNMELLQQNVIEKVVGCDDVQFQWSLLSVNIENAEDEQLVLQDIVKLWVTIRGYSMVATWMEAYKQTEKANLQKSTGLRKSLSGNKSK